MRLATSKARTWGSNIDGRTDNRIDCRRSRLIWFNDHGYLTLKQISRERRQSIRLSVRTSIFDPHVPAFDVASLIQAFAERDHHRSPRARRLTVQESDDRHCWLLRARRKRPHSRRAAEQRDELAPPHSI